MGEPMTAEQLTHLKLSADIWFVTGRASALASNAISDLVAEVERLRADIAEYQRGKDDNLDAARAALADNARLRAALQVYADPSNWRHTITAAEPMLYWAGLTDPISDAIHVLIDRCHVGDPCIYCGTPHDDVAVGPCPGRTGKE